MSNSDATIRYAMFSVFQTANTFPIDAMDRKDMVREALRAVGGAQRGSDTELTVRGWYDLSGVRSDADLLVWWHGPTLESVQGAYQRLRQSEFGRCIDPVWSNVGVHREAGFNAPHTPAFMADANAGQYICVAPFVRSNEWYALPADERSTLMDEQEQKATQAQVLTSTVSAFGLGDYEWLSAYEAGQAHHIVDFMSALRTTGARRYIGEEAPFYTGPRVTLQEWVNNQPQSDYDE